MLKDDLRECWKVVAHQINNAIANILLEASTLQLHTEKLAGPKERILEVLKSMDLSVEVINTSLREMDEMWEKINQAPSLDLKTWEKDFRQRLIELKEKGFPG